MSIKDDAKQVEKTVWAKLKAGAKHPAVTFIYGLAAGLVIGAL